MDTIAAVATAAGSAAVAVIRISGPAAHEAVRRLIDGPLPPLRRLSLRRLRRPGSGEVLDEGMVALFAAGSSATGETVAEVHLHGGVAVTAAVLAALTDAGAVRLARPGEFSRRALANRRMDLARLEGVADLVAAETEAQRRQAARLMTGALSSAVAGWRGALVAAWAQLEADADFADEEIPDTTQDRARAAIAGLRAEIEAALRDAPRAALLRRGAEVAVIGPPNAGKSSLINRLAGRMVALTAPSPGTTRDVIEARCDLDGAPVTLLDTAGLRDTADPIEAAGVDWGRRRAAAADLRLVVNAPDAEPGVAAGVDDIDVWCKADIARGPGLNVSTVTGEGLDELIAALAARVRPGAPEGALVAHARHAEALSTAAAQLRLAETAPIEIAAEALRETAGALDAIVGRVDVEDLLDDIFSRFCIGK